MTHAYVIIMNDDPHQTLVGQEPWETLHGGRMSPQPFYILRARQEDIVYPADEEAKADLPPMITVMPLHWLVPADRQDEYIFHSPNDDMQARAQAQKALAEKIQDMFPWIEEINPRKLPVVEARTYYGEPRQDETHPEILHSGGVVTIMMVL